jgi:hypothetical protein
VPVLAISARRSHAVSLRDVANYDRRHATPYGRRWWASALVVLAYVVAQIVLVSAYLPIAGFADEVERRVFAGFCILTALYTGLLGALLWRGVSRRVRIEALASSLGLAYSDRQPLAGFAGTALQRPGRQWASDVVEPGLAPAVPDEFAAGTFAPGTGLTMRRAGFVQIRLDRDLPHIVLENRRSRVLRTTGQRFRALQRLSLEGDFDRTFSLYCPEGYERDALYIMTPDMMALLLDAARDCEIEIVDGWLVAYVGHAWRLWRPERFDALVALVAALGARARRRSHNYRDERMPRGSGLVGARGRRLRLRPSLGSILSTSASMVLGVYGIVSWLTV